MRPTLTPILLAIALIVPMTTPTLAQQAETQRSLSISAEGSVAVRPDIAIVQIGVAEQRETASAALDAMSVAAQAVLDRLTTAGVAAEDMQTSQLMLTPVYGPSGLSSAAKITGFEASTGLTVRIEDLEIIGKVLDAVVQDGANRLDGVQFGLSDPEPHLEQARTEAVRAARAKAELLATAAGVTLGPLMTLAEQGGSVPSPMRMAMEDMTMSMSVPIADGEVNVTASVHMVYAIE